MRVIDRLLVRVSEDAIEPAEALRFVADPAAGGSCLFLGTVRDHSDAGRVTGLEYEAWAELAEKRFREIAGELFERWPVRRAALLHRFGRLDIGDVSVAVACSAAHRDQAFEACRFGIDRVKDDAPIWKKELLATGEAEWVTGG